MRFESIYLASRSPRRRELLQQMAVDFTVINSDVDETVRAKESPADYVVRIAEAKARAGRALLSNIDPKPVLAADTAVVVQNRIFGKPVNDADARRMLKQLSGSTHQVLTAVTLATQDGVLQTKISTSEVSFAQLSDSQIDWYLQTGEGNDKAGAYAIHGLAALFIEKIAGSYSGIVGLPIRETGQLLMRMESKREQ